MNENKIVPEDPAQADEGDAYGKSASLEKDLKDQKADNDRDMANLKDIAQKQAIAEAQPSVDMLPGRAGTTQDIMDVVKAQIEEWTGVGDADKAALAESQSYPHELLMYEANQEVAAGMGMQWGGPVYGELANFFRFYAGGPVYKLSLDRPSYYPITDEIIEKAAFNLLDEMGGIAQPSEDDAGHEDHFDSPYDDDYETVVSETDFLAELDEIITPRIITQEDLIAAGLEGGPGFTHAEALLAALCAADAVAPDAPMDEDMAEALYEYAEKEKWEGRFLPETLYRQAMGLMQEEASLFTELDVDFRHWFLTFTLVGRAMSAEARDAKAIYMGKLITLQREIERTRSQRKLADRKAEKQKKREQRPLLLKRAAERWRKNQAKNEAKAERARRAGKPAGRPGSKR